MKDIKSNTNSLLCAFGMGCIVGMVVFLLVCGYKILDPSYTDWLMTNADYSLPYYGLRFYLREESTINTVYGMTYPYTISPIFTDINIPIALFLKLALGIVPYSNDFQIQGIVTLSFFVLQGASCMIQI